MYCSRCGTWTPATDIKCAACGAALQDDNAPLVITPSLAPVPIWKPVYAGFWRRGFAMLVDIAVLTPFTLLIEILFGHRPFDPVRWDRAYWLGQIGGMVMNWIYSATLESSGRQGTLGQQLMEMRVADLHGRRISFGRASARHFAQYLSLLVLGVGYVMIAFTARKQALHDMIAGCLLIRPEARTPAATIAAHPAPGPGSGPLAGAGR